MSLTEKRGGYKQCNYVYSFGAPGHGKGCFDGIGGKFKHKINEMIKAAKTSSDGVPGVESGYISNVNDVFKALKHFFESDDPKV
eukprot:4661222-Ditylum_brightwellii.AAC.1